MARVLHSSDEVKAAIRRIFRDPRRRRVAIVAYVGKGAHGYLPKPKGLELYCWPQAGSTIASAISDLQQRRVRVHFADRVHMKVYWAKGVGAVIGSANLSDNALGVGGLREAGVEVPAASVDIDRLIRDIRPRSVDSRSLKSLIVAERNAKNGRGGPPRSGALPTFPEWAAQARRRRWKWGYFDNYVARTESRRARAATRAIDPAIRTPAEVLFCSRSQYAAGDWILEVRRRESGMISTPRWVYVQRVVLVERDDPVYDPQFPYQAVQALEARHCPSPPFQIEDRFRRALGRAARSYGIARVAKQVDGQRPAKALLRLMLDAY